MIDIQNTSPYNLNPAMPTDDDLKLAREIAAQFGELTWIESYASGKYQGAFFVPQRLENRATVAKVQVRRDVELALYELSHANDALAVGEDSIYPLIHASTGARRWGKYPAITAAVAFVNAAFHAFTVWTDFLSTVDEVVSLIERQRYEEAAAANLLHNDVLSVSAAAELAGVTVQAIRDILRDEARRVDVFPGAFRKHNPKNDEWRIPRKDVEAYTPRKA